MNNTDPAGTYLGILQLLLILLRKKYEKTHRFQYPVKFHGYIPTEHEAELITGLQAGGISPLALLNKGFQVVMDSSAENYGEIYISGGQRGLNIRLLVEALVKLTNARIEKIISGA